MPTNLSAEYSVKGSDGRGEKCTVINISLNGAGLEFYSSEPIALGVTLVLTIFDPENKESVGTEGVVKWTKQGERDFSQFVEAFFIKAVIAMLDFSDGPHLLSQIL